MSDTSHYQFDDHSLLILVFHPTGGKNSSSFGSRPTPLQRCPGRYQDMSIGFSQPNPLPRIPSAVRDPDTRSDCQGVHGWEESSRNDGQPPFNSYNNIEYTPCFSVPLILVYIIL